ncbi:hypothetical protein QA596_06660 [Balneolales bacterium ANBcel1]|nr:hypothetical protein [Balneolales bacterium ANBcel1]
MSIDSNRDKLDKAHELYDQIFDYWGHKETDPDTGEELSSPNSLEQIEFAKSKIAEIEKLNVSDEEFNALLANVKEMAEDRNAVGHTIYSEIVDEWDFAEAETEEGDALYHPTSKKHIESANEKLAEIDKLNITDQELIGMVENVREIVNEAPKRRFAGSYWIAGVIGIFVLIITWSDTTTFFDKMGGHHSMENAEAIHSSAVNRIESRISTLENQPENSFRRDEQLQDRREELSRVSEMSPEAYVRSENRRHRRQAASNLFQTLFLVGVFGGYLYVSRAPVFLINRRKRQIEMMKKSSNFFQKLVFGTIAAVWSIPITTYVTRWSDGSETTDSNAIVVLAIGIFVTVIVLAIVFYVMIIALPFLAVLNYVRNYQYERVDDFMAGFKAKIGWA